MNELIERMKKGDRRALSRLLSYVEACDERSFDLLSRIWPLTGRAYTVGVTGPAGAGKSTLIDQLIGTIRAEGKKIGVVAVDPTSPITGGAVLGDRVRMQRHADDPDVFIRSVGSRGGKGGVSFATRALMQLLDAFGTDVILVETVGAGQSEVDVADLVNTTVLVLVPEAGDAIQALKAGILEVADVFVVNKKDRNGAEAIVHHIESMLSMGSAASRWKPPIVTTQAVNGEGVPEVWRAVKSHAKELASGGLSSEERLRRRLHELAEVIQARVSTEMMAAARKDAGLMERLAGKDRPNLYEEAESFLSGSRSGRTRKRPRAITGK